MSKMLLFLDVGDVVQKADNILCCCRLPNWFILIVLIVFTFQTTAVKPCTLANNRQV